ncbi:MAG: hypothetical protein HC898_10155 [Phycisphaerales bacterium]|nr:hypothetical protein [Phycisphaerales bacterium]
MSPADPIDLAQNLAQTRKYAHLCPGTLQRVAAWAMERHPKTDDALKAAKRKLHQVFASYVSDDVRRWGTWLNQVDWKDDAQIKALAEKVLATHASSAERRVDCSRVYEQLWAITGTPASLVDLGGGVNAFALPWMGLPRTTMYYCTEIDSRMVEAINRWLRGCGQTGEAFVRICWWTHGPGRWMWQCC